MTPGVIAPPNDPQLRSLRSRRNHSDIIEYLERIQATLDPFAGRFVIHGPPAEVVEGTWPGSMVLIEFPSLAEARAWYDSPAYRAILSLRTDHIEGDLLLIEGVGPNYDPAERASRPDSPAASYSGAEILSARCSAAASSGQRARSRTPEAVHGQPHARPPARRHGAASAVRPDARERLSLLSPPRPLS
ncbi:DUF1330 domain-containing protein [Streptomyces afghaniensis]|uniref:DUF1330 domain-containing protein n=1 Tax=Streptomyces afghaniensis TaxID=66865 RepID=UPI0031451EE6